MNAQVLIEKLGLQPLAGEGGFCRETYRSSERVVVGPRETAQVVHCCRRAVDFCAIAWVGHCGIMTMSGRRKSWSGCVQTLIATFPSP